MREEGCGVVSRPLARIPAELFEAVRELELLEHEDEERVAHVEEELLRSEVVLRRIDRNLGRDASGRRAHASVSICVLQSLTRQA